MGRLRLDDLERLVPPEDPGLPTQSLPPAGAVPHAYCPLIRRRCADVDCRDCPAFLQAYSGHIAWLCSVCAGDAPKDARRPFWADGGCDGCGFQSFILSAFEFE